MSGKKIKQLRKGSAPSLLNTEKANEVIKAINALQDIRIVRGEYDSVSYGDTGITIQIKKVKLRDIIEESGDEEPIPIKGKFPITIKKRGGILEVGIDGFTKVIRYCGGINRFFMLRKKYNSNE